MAAPTREELEQADAALARAGYDENERLSVLLQLQNVEVPGMPSFAQPFVDPATKGLREQVGAAQMIVPASGAALGGMAAKAGLRKFAPALGRVLGPELAGVGEASGAFLGGLATGQSLEQAGTGALLSGVAGAGTERAVQEVGRGFARAGKVTKRTMKETLTQGGVGRLKTMLPGVGEEAYINEAEALSRGATKARVEKSPGRRAAEQKIRAFDTTNTQTQQVYQPPFGTQQVQTGGVDFAPVKQHILSLVDDRATSTGRVAVNEQLKRTADRIPDNGTMDDLDHFIREYTEPIKGQVQNLEASLPAAVQQKIVAGARRYRNQLLPQAKADFVQAQNYMKATKNIRGMLVDKNGDLRKSAENVWRSIPRNKVVLRSFQEYDKVHGTRFAENALELARKANWTPGDGATALGMIDASVGWFGRAAATTSRSVGKVLTGAAIPAGRTAAAGAAFYNAMNNP